MHQKHPAAPIWLARCFGAALLLFAACHIDAANLLSNPGFESDPGGHNQTLPGWQNFGANYYNETDGTAAHGGTNYFKVYQAFNGGVNYTGIYQDYVSGPGAIYAADGWAYTAASDVLMGANTAWLEVTFRDATGNILALYRSTLISTNTIATGVFPKNHWNNLAITNQCDTGNLQPTNTVTKLVAPPGTVFLRYQITLQGDTHNANGSVYFDDLNLSPGGSAVYGDMNIVWTDEFDGTAIKTNIWTYDIGAGGWGNNELEFYTNLTSNAYVTNGMLHIVARKESMGGANYSSVRMKSQGLFSFTYGRLEWRAKLPSGTGCWPALWLLGNNISSIGWPGCGEVDVLENNGSNPYFAQGSLHSGGDTTAIYNFFGGDSVTNFHTYTLDWMTNAFLFYIDGHLYQTQTSWTSSAGSYPIPFNRPFFLLMNLAIGGNYVGNPSTNAINSGISFPAEMQVDYVRVYSLTDPFRIAIKQTGSGIVLTWPTNIVCRVQGQTAMASGIGSTWSQIGTSTNQMQITPVSDSGYFRLVSP
ncbi:MAG: glycoside hydrolase family 16 protein [Verrucomicrobia bacterium]|nr:glycoside hydrolase family 16 protein [Verrucomicrobiota bacterium]